MYSVNQVKHLYVVNSVKAPADGEEIAVMEASDAVGTLVPKTSVDECYIYFQYKGKGGVIATDRIKKHKVKWISITSASSLRKPLKKVTIALDSNVNGGLPVIGQDYIINFSFKNYFGMSDEDTYEKHAAARAYTAVASDLYRDLALSLAKNMSREVDQPFTIALSKSGGSDPVTVYTKKEDLAGTYTGIVLLEAIQPWELGRFKQLRPDYSVHFVPVIISGLERNDWATATVADDTNYIGNGRETADLEWFCMGERGDQYRGKDWPMSITTTASLMVEPEAEYNYMIIHFWDDIDNEGPQKSERDMVFVAKSTGSVNFSNLASTVSTVTGNTVTIVDGVAQ